jgi:hypothetical protein
MPMNGKGPDTANAWSPRRGGGSFDPPGLSHGNDVSKYC